MTAEVESDKALRESEEQLANIVANLPGRVYRRILHSDGSISFPYVGIGGDGVPTFNPEKKIFRTSDILQHVHLDDWSLWDDALIRSAENMEPYDFEFRRILQSGEVSWVRVIGRPHKRENGDIVWDAISLDVMDRKEAEMALDASEQTRAAMLAAIPDPLFSHDKNGVFLDFHSSGEFETLVPPAEFLGRTIREVMPADVAEKSMACIERAIETGETQLLEYPLTKKGQLHFFEARYVACGNDEVLAVVRDVTDRTHAEDDLRASEIRFRRLVENAGDAFLLYDVDGNIVDANRYAAETFGYSRDELLTLSVRDVAVNFDERRLIDLWNDLSTGEAMTVSRVYRRKEGTTFPVDVRVSGVEVDGRPHYLALARDTTERDRVQTQLAHASKMATLGEMGAGIAHELNQPMQIIRIAADHCMVMLEDGAADLKKLKSRLRVGFESHAARANLRTRSMTEAA